MKYNDYLAGVNKTWKTADGLIEFTHCRLAILEEVGEISGWYKKHFGYGRPKEGKIKTGLKEEFGDLLYYLTKISELSRCESVLEGRFEDDWDTGSVDGFEPAAALADLAGYSTTLIVHSFFSGEFVQALAGSFDILNLFIKYEGFDLEDIQLSNLRKLEVRHGDSFKDKQALPSDRNKDAENEALNR